MYEITGTLKVIKEVKKVSDTFQIREFILTDNSSNYPQHIQFQLTQERCRYLVNAHEGDEIKVGFYIQGREYAKDGTVKYFNTLNVFRIDILNSKTKEDSEPILGNDDLAF